MKRRMNKYVKDFVVLVNQQLIAMGKLGKRLEEIQESDLYSVAEFYLLKESYYYGFNYYKYDENGNFIISKEPTQYIQFIIK